MYPFYPVTKEQREKWGRFIHNVEGGRGTLFKWVKDVQEGKPPVKTGQGGGIGNAMSQVRRALLEHKRGGREGLFIPRDLDPAAGLWVVEGPTDCAALLGLGIEAVGRPSCSGGMRHLAGLARRLRRR